jgi:hypothetical protein
MWLRRKRDSRYRTQGTVPALAQSPFQQWLSLRSSIGSVSASAPALAPSPLLAPPSVAAMGPAPFQQWLGTATELATTQLQKKSTTPFQQPAKCPFQVTTFLKFQNMAQSLSWVQTLWPGHRIRTSSGSVQHWLRAPSSMGSGSVPALAQAPFQHWFRAPLQHWLRAPFQHWLRLRSSIGSGLRSSIGTGSVPA